MEKVIFVSDYPNFHQLGLWDEFIKNDVDFIFLATDHISEERKKMHYEELTRPYIKQSSDYSFDQLKEMLTSANSVILGHISDKRIYKACKKVKRIYFNNEHFLKKWKSTNFLVYLKRIYLLHFYLRKAEKFALCNSYYAGKEYHRFLLKKDHIFNFGYFPALDIKERSSINFNALFSGRCLDWKRPDLAIDGMNALIKLTNNKNRFVGEGPYLDESHKHAKKLGCESKIKWHNFLSHDELLKEMESNCIYLFTSNHQEGWGVVLNEALSRGNIVIANRKAGSTKTLIKDGVNGFIFNGTKRDLLKVITMVTKLENDKLLNISKEANKTISDLYNNKIAASRLFNLLSTGKTYESGPVSIWNAK